MRKQLFLNRYGVAVAFLLLLQQSIVASSSLWLVWAAEAIHWSQPFDGWLCLYFVSLILPYVPGGMALIAVEKWSFLSQARLIEMASERLVHRVALWGNRHERDRRVPLFAKEGPQIISDFVGYIYHLTACTLNTLLNLLTVSLIVEPYLLLAYSIGIILAGAFIRAQARTSEGYSRLGETARISLTDALFSMWDNLTLGNDYNRSLWEHLVRRRYSRTRSIVLCGVTFNQVVVITIALLTLLPTIVIIVWALITERGNDDYTITLVVILPRIFQILSSTHEVLSGVFEWNTQKGRLAVLEGLFAVEDDPQALVGRIDFQRINFTCNQEPIRVMSIDTLEEAIRRSAPCRVTIVGGNGSGKSTILTLLKASMRKGAFFLPAEHRLLFRASRLQGSTGQRIRKILSEITAACPGQILLLDEWDANLDATNRRELSVELDELFRRGVSVVEVRHFASTTLSKSLTC